MKGCVMTREVKMRCYIWDVESTRSSVYWNAGFEKKAVNIYDRVEAQMWSTDLKTLKKMFKYCKKNKLNVAHGIGSLIRTLKHGCK